MNAKMHKKVEFIFYDIAWWCFHFFFCSFHSSNMLFDTKLFIFPTNSIPLIQYQGKKNHKKMLKLYEKKGQKKIASKPWKHFFCVFCLHSIEISVLWSLYEKCTYKERTESVKMYTHRMTVYDFKSLKLTVDNI